MYSTYTYNFLISSNYNWYFLIDHSTPVIVDLMLCNKDTLLLSLSLPLSLSHSLLVKFFSNSFPDYVSIYFFLLSHTRTKCSYILHFTQSKMSIFTHYILRIPLIQVKLFYTYLLINKLFIYLITLYIHYNQRYSMYAT